MKKICVVTGSRAEYGLLKPVLERIRNDMELNLLIFVTGMHLAPEFGLTYREIENDGFVINEKIEMLLSSDTSTSISKSMGLGLIGFADALEREKPDLVILLGDRYEILSAAIAAMNAKIPIAHLHGGETTEGAVDEAIRHAITKMSYLHFTSTEDYRNRVIQLGEDPTRVFNVGALGIEVIKSTKCLTKIELENALGFKLDKPTALVTYHSTTLESRNNEEHFLELLNSLDRFVNLKIIFTKSNSDEGGRVINSLIDEYVSNNCERAAVFTNLGQLRYISAMKYVDIMIGNSSSGLLEFPYFKKPTINIGDRQKGRVQTKSIINCSPIITQIVKAIEQGLSDEFLDTIKNQENPYGEGETSNQVVSIIKIFLDKGINLKKQFYNRGKL